MKVKILVRYGELSNKGRNKKMFTQRLARNIKKALQTYPMVKVQPEHDFLFVELNGAPQEEILERLKPIFGIQSFSPIYLVEKDPEAVKQAVVALLEPLVPQSCSFKIATRRSDHSYVMDTNQMNVFLGDAVLDAYPTINVQMKDPDITVRVDVRKEQIMISLRTIQGAGGLPVGTSGRVALMMSGGIDSPVAAYLALKRGMEVQFVHFASPPYTSPQALDKTKRLAAKLAHYCGSVQFFTVPFTKIQEELKKNVPDSYLMTIMRRMMLRITDSIRQQQGGLAIVNGESVGQVASQTLESMVAINEVTTTPVIRPVATMDKLDIIAVAQAIGTFDISIEPFEDCCTVFAPPSPKTRPNLAKVHQYEKRLAVEELCERCLANVEIEEIVAQQVQPQDEFEQLL